MPRFAFAVALHAFLFYDAATCSENEKHLTRQSAELGGPPLELRASVLQSAGSSGPEPKPQPPDSQLVHTC